VVKRTGTLHGPYPARIVKKGRCREDGYSEPYAEVEKPDGKIVMPMGWNYSGPIFEVGTEGTAEYVAASYASLWLFKAKEE
jgi:hypothetical protein